ncbi:MAG: LSM domain-containing protein [Candidatus Methanoperedens sp.]|jgi:small nuclear ribonucleoprotein (snRNP)-like protein|nr:LSM domain-containing protein [Candidatus Methanoperedens sp.]
MDTISERGKTLFPTKKVQTLIGKRIQVEMKGDKNTLEGKLESADDYLNLHLTDTHEINEGVKARSLGSVVLRGNNIILIVPVAE